MMRALVISATLLSGMLACQSYAGTIGFTFGGPGVSGAVQLTYGPDKDQTYAQAYEVTGITGVFTDLNNSLNIIDAPIGPLVAVTHDTPEPSNLLAPHDFSRFAVATGLSPVSNGFLTYDNLYYPGGSPQTASDYPPHGGFLDIYGLMFEIGGGRVVDLWSNGDTTGTGSIDWGVAVATHDKALDYVEGGVSITPEPGAFVLLGTGLLGIFSWRRASRRRTE